MSEKKIGNMSGTAKLPTNIIKNIASLNNTPPEVIAPEDDGKVLIMKLSGIGGNELWAKNFCSIPFDVNDYKNHPDTYDTWLKTRAQDCILEVIKQLRNLDT